MGTNQNRRTAADPATAGMAAARAEQYAAELEERVL